MIFDGKYGTMKKEKGGEPVGKEKKMFWLLAACAVLPYLLYGFRYFPVLDDYIQYWGYGAYQNSSYVFFDVGTLATRPLASFLDVAFWGKLWHVLPIALVLVTALLIGAAYHIKAALKKAGITMSPLYYLILFLLPVGMEARFWLSASTRIVVGLFFAAGSLHVLASYLFEKRSGWKLLAFAALSLISCGFYESVSVFSAGCAILLWLYYVASRPESKKCFAVPVISALSIGLMFAYYRIFSGLGALGSRAAGMSFDNFGDKMAALFTQLGEIFGGFYNGIVLGAIEGIKILCQRGFFGFFLLLLMGVLAFFILHNVEKSRKLSLWQILLLEIGGLLLFLAPLVPNLLAETVWLTNRSIFVSLIGLAFMLEPLMMLIPTRVKKIILPLVAIVFMLSAVNEYGVYQKVHEQDMALVDKVIAKMEAPAKMGECEVAVLLPAPIETEQNAFYKDHVKSVFGADWSLTGAVRARMESLAPKRIYPVLPGESYNTENTQVIDLEIK